MGTTRPNDSGRVDAVGRPIKIGAGGGPDSRSTAPTPGGPPAARAVVPAALAGYITGPDQTPLQDRLDELGWESVEFIRVEGDQDYDDTAYFTPMWEMAVRGDLSSGVGKKLRAAVTAQAAEDGIEDDELDDYLDEMCDMSAVDSGAVRSEHLAAAGLLIIWRNPDDDPFTCFHVDDLDLDD